MHYTRGAASILTAVVVLSAGAWADADTLPADNPVVGIVAPTPSPSPQPAPQPQAAPAPTPQPQPQFTQSQACRRVKPRRGRARRECFALNQLGRIEIPKIRVSQPVFDGWDQRVIDRGPSHLPGSAWPGGRGNTVIAGHRTTYSRPFLNIDRLRPGDRVTLTTSVGRFTYEVYEHFVVTPRDVWVAHPTEESILTFFACHPKRSSRLRYVVRARLIG